MELKEFPAAETYRTSAPAGPLVVFCDGYSRIYGAQRSLLTLYRRFNRERRFRLHFVYIEEGELSSAVRDEGIPATQLRAGPLLGSYDKRLLRLRPWDYPRLAKEMISYSWSLRSLLRKLGADLLHCNSDRAGLLNFLGAAWARVPHVNHIRRDRSFGRLDRVAYDRAHEVIWVSRRIRDEFAERNRIDCIKGRVIYNARVLPDADGPSTRAELIGELGLPDDALIALTAAGLEERKDHENLVRAAEIVCRQVPRTCFLLAGDDQSKGQSRRELIGQMVSQRGLARNVKFLGHRNDIGRLMRGADILVSSSKEEALGGSLIEAMGYGLPCVATDTGGTGEIVPDGRCGYLVSREDSAALAKRVLELLGDEPMRRQFRSNARRHFDETFTIERCAERTSACFDEIISRYGRNRIKSSAMRA